MDIWKFYDITHREHLICNPTSEERLQQLVDLVRLDRDARVLDIACGKGEFLIRLANAYRATGVGIDISPYFISAARKKHLHQVPTANLTFTQIDGAVFKPEHPHGFKLASCFGASWIFNGHQGTLKALSEMVEPGGWVIVGEPYWHQEPSASYLEAEGVGKDTYGTHLTNVEVGEAMGLSLVHTFVSTKNDFDRYEGLQWFAADDYARSHQHDPDSSEIIGQVRKSRDHYLRWGRDTLGWAIYAFRR